MADAPGDALETRHERYEQLIAAAQKRTAIKVAVAHPCDQSSMRGVSEAMRLHLIEPILVGPIERMRQAAEQVGLDIGGVELVDAEHSHAAAEKAVELVRAGKAEALMKGSLHTDELMAAVVSKTGGIRTERRISHCFIMDVPGHPDPLIITDAAVNIAPDLDAKVDIIQNAIDLAHAMGADEVRVAILSAMETVTSKVPSTIEAAALCKMAERGQITGAILDGPLALDNAISPEAAAIKKIASPVAGRAEHSRRSRPRGRQHAGQEPLISGEGARCRNGTGRARAGHSHQPRRFIDQPPRVLRGRRHGSSREP